MKTLSQLVKEIENALNAYNEDLIQGDLNAMQANAERLAQVKIDTKDEHNVWVRYPKMFAAAGGKSNYNLLNDFGWGPRAQEIVRKNTLAKIESRNYRIAAKMLKLGEDSEVESGELVHSRDGFNGYFRIKTATDTKFIKIDTIVAGGYNIQCAHLRCLVTVK